jgi:hypothetical protein
MPPLVHVPVVVFVDVTVMVDEKDGSMDGDGAGVREDVVEPVLVGVSPGVTEANAVKLEVMVAVSVAST